jgi:hypothetical protein
VLGGAIYNSFQKPTDREFHIPAEEVVQVEGARTEALREVA